MIYYFCVYLLVLMEMEEPSYFQSTGEPNYDPVKTVLTAARQWMQAARATAKESEKVQVFFAWEPPCNGQFKLNVDGSGRSSSGCIGAGGVIRNLRGDWVSGFSVSLGERPGS